MAISAMHVRSGVLAALTLFSAIVAVRGYQTDFPGLSCPPGWLPQRNLYAPGFHCTEDQCYITGCGPGNSCSLTPTQNPSSPVYYLRDCQCNPPYILTAYSYATAYRQDTCYLPGSDVCNPNPCQNGGKCNPKNNSEPGGPSGPTAYTCDCTGTGFRGVTCTSPGVPSEDGTGPPPVSATVNGYTGPRANNTYIYGPCDKNTAYPNTCLFKDGGHFICCDSSDCGPIGPDGNTPLCLGSGFKPYPNVFPPQPTVCGVNEASGFPVKCPFAYDQINGQNDFVCCDSSGCDGFNPPDFQYPHCKGNGYVPYFIGGAQPGPDSTPSPGPTPAPNTPPTSSSQGVCGSGEAAGFPTRCYFNSDPQGRYVCCDTDGCNGFAPPDYSFPHCKTNGYVPPGYGVGSSSTPPASTPPSAPPSGSQGVCGTGAAAGFPVRCWYNNDPQGRYVCCDSAGCDGFNPPDYFFPHCKASGYVPPSL